MSVWVYSVCRWRPCDGWSPVQGVLSTVYRLRNWKSGQGPQGLLSHRHIDDLKLCKSFQEAIIKNYLLTFVDTATEVCVFLNIRQLEIIHKFPLGENWELSCDIQRDDQRHVWHFLILDNFNVILWHPVALCNLLMGLLYRLVQLV
jgi:hypothetical protein